MFLLDFVGDMEQTPLLGTIRIALCLVCLLIASWSDIKTRKVSDKIWILLGPVGLLLTLLSSYIAGESTLMLLGLSIALMSGLSLALFYLGLIGGADAKAFICLALAMPSAPTPPLFGFAQSLFPLSVFSNGAIAAFLSVFYMLGKNALWTIRTRSGLFEGIELPLPKKLLAMMTSYKVTVGYARTNEHLRPIEELRIDGERVVRNLKLSAKIGDRSEDLKLLDDFARGRSEHDYVWVTPNLPFIVFITAGFFLSLIAGDLILLPLVQ